MFSYIILIMLITLISFPFLIIFIPTSLRPIGFNIEEQAKILNYFYKSLAYYDVNLMQAFKYSYWKVLLNISYYNLRCGVDFFETKKYSVWEDEFCSVKNDLEEIFEKILKKEIPKKYPTFYKYFEEYLDKIKLKNLPYKFINVKKIDYEWYDEDKGLRLVNIYYNLSYTSLYFNHTLVHNFSFLFYDYSMLFLTLFKHSKRIVEEDIIPSCLKKEGKGIIFDKSCNIFSSNYGGIKTKVFCEIECKDSKVLLKTLHYYNISIPYWNFFDLYFIRKTVIEECSGKFIERNTLYKLVCASKTHCPNIEKSTQFIYDEGGNVIGIKMKYTVDFSINPNCEKIGCVAVPIVKCVCYKGTPVFYSDDCNCLTSS